MVEATDIEKENLEAHVELCAQRYGALESRLEKIEKKVVDLQSLIERSQMSITKVLIGTAGTVVAAVLTAIVTILIKMPK
jgi:DNA-directed RNA polymerase specialized sigma subunit